MDERSVLVINSFFSLAALLLLHRIIEEFDMDYISRGSAIAILAALFSVMWAGAYFGLRNVAKSRAS